MQPPQVIQGPALVTYGGQTFFTTGDITLSIVRETFDVTTSQHGVTDRRHKSQLINIAFSAVGQVALIEYVLTHIQGLTPGQSLIPSLGAPVAFTGEADNETITAAAHGLANNERVTIISKTGGSGWSTGVVYYVIGVTTNTFQISLTASGSAVAITTDVTAGTLAKVEETALVIQPLYNAGGSSRIWTFPRAGLTGVGGLKFSGSAPLTAQLTFAALESFAASGTYYTTAAYAAPSSGLLDDYNAALVMSTALSLVWATDPNTLASGDVQMTSMDGWTLNIEFPTKSHERDGYGIVDVTVGAQNTNLTVTGDAAAIYDYTGTLVGESSWATLMGTVPRPGQPGTRKELWLTLLYDDAATGLSSGTGLVRLGTAEWTSLGGAWGAEINRSGAVTFKVIPTFTAGVRHLYPAGASSIFTS